MVVSWFSSDIAPKNRLTKAFDGKISKSTINYGRSDRFQNRAASKPLIRQHKQKQHPSRRVTGIAFAYGRSDRFQNRAASKPLIRQHKQKQHPSRRVTGIAFAYGRSDRFRTCGLNIPNVARYQLRHTPTIYYQYIIPPDFVYVKCLIANLSVLRLRA